MRKSRTHFLQADSLSSYSKYQDKRRNEALKRQKTARLQTSNLARKIACLESFESSFRPQGEEERFDGNAASAVETLLNDSQRGSAVASVHPGNRMLSEIVSVKACEPDSLTEDSQMDILQDNGGDVTTADASSSKSGSSSKFGRRTRGGRRGAGGPFRQDPMLGHEGSSHVGSSSQEASSRSFYSKQLMIPEWMTDIPLDIGAQWFVMPRPEGRRCLLISSRGWTTSRLQRSGSVLHRFRSPLPDGSPSTRVPSAHGDSSGYCILDAVYERTTHTYYVQDLMCWRGHAMYDYPAEFRLFWIASKWAEEGLYEAFESERAQAFETSERMAVEDGDVLLPAAAEEESSVVTAGQTAAAAQGAERMEDMEEGVGKAGGKDALLSSSSSSAAPFIPRSQASPMPAPSRTDHDHRDYHHDDANGDDDRHRHHHRDRHRHPRASPSFVNIVPLPFARIAASPLSSSPALPTSVSPLPSASCPSSQPPLPPATNGNASSCSCSCSYSSSSSSPSPSSSSSHDHEPACSAASPLSFGDQRPSFPSFPAPPSFAPPSLPSPPPPCPVLRAAHSGMALPFPRDGLLFLHAGGHYAAGQASPLALLWKDAACAAYVLDTDADGQALVRQTAVLELRPDGSVATGDETPVVLGQLSLEATQKLLYPPPPTEKHQQQQKQQQRNQDGGREEGLSGEIVGGHNGADIREVDGSLLNASNSTATCTDPLYGDTSSSSSSSSLSSAPPAKVELKRRLIQFAILTEEDGGSGISFGADGRPTGASLRFLAALSPHASRTRGAADLFSKILFQYLARRDLKCRSAGAIDASGGVGGGGGLVTFDGLERAIALSAVCGADNTLC